MDSVARGGRPIVLGTDGLTHPFACVGCERVVLSWKDRRCKLCVKVDRILGVAKLPHGDSAKNSIKTRPMSACGPAPQIDYEADHDPTGWLEPPRHGDAIPGTLEAFDLGSHVEGIGDPITLEMVSMRALGETNSAIARKFKLDRKSVRDRLAAHDAGSGWKRPGKPIHPYFKRCTSCRKEQRYCGAGHVRDGAAYPNCCPDCWHPGNIIVSDSDKEYLYRWETPFNDIERAYWNDWPVGGGGTAPSYIRSAIGNAKQPTSNRKAKLK